MKILEEALKMGNYQIFETEAKGSCQMNCGNLGSWDVFFSVRVFPGCSYGLVSFCRGCLVHLIDKAREAQRFDFYKPGPKTTFH